ncbi:hypothetical protein D9M73_129180 [compost metagenome]
MLDAEAVLIAVERVGFLGTGEEFGGRDERLAGRDDARGEREIALEHVAGGGVEARTHRCAVIGDDGGEEIFVAEAEPAAGRVEEILTRFGRIAPDLAEEARFLALQIVEGDVVGGAFVEHADRADMVGPGIGLGADARARDQRIGAQRNRRGAGIGDGLAHREHIFGVDREGQREALALLVVPVERDRGVGGQRCAVGGEDGIAIGNGDAVAIPAEAREIRILGAARREQADRRGVLVDRLLVFGQRQIIDPRALQVDRALQIGGLDCHARGFAADDLEIAQARRVGYRRATGWGGDNLALAVDHLGRGRIGGMRKEFRRQEIAAEQNDRGQHREQDEIPGIFFHAGVFRSIRALDRVRTRPRDGTARFAWLPTTRLSLRHSGEAR